MKRLLIAISLGLCLTAGAANAGVIHIPVHAPARPMHKARAPEHKVQTKKEVEQVTVVPYNRTDDGMYELMWWFMLGFIVLAATIATIIIIMV